MSFKGVMEAVSDIVDKVEERHSRWGFKLGEIVNYHRKGFTKSEDTYPECEVIGFTEKSIQVKFNDGTASGYRKYVEPYQLYHKGDKHGI